MINLIDQINKKKIICDKIIPTTIPEDDINNAYTEIEYKLFNFREEKNVNYILY